MVQIKWKRGEFYEFRATAKVHLGAIPLDIWEDDLVEFDGQTLRYAGADYSVPSLRAGIKAGWLVPSDDNVSRYISQPAGVKVRPATPQTRAEGDSMVFEAASEEEAVVGTLEGHQERREASRHTKPSRRASREDSTPPQRHARKEAAPPPRAAPKPVRIEEPAAVDYSQASDISDSDKKAIERADAINRQRIAEALAQEVPEPGEYDEPDEAPQKKFGVIQVDDQGGEVVGKQYKFSGAAAGAPGDASLREAVPISKMSRHAGRAVATTPQEERPRPAGQRTQVPAEGNTDIAEKLDGGATGDVAEALTGDALTELLPNAAQGPSPTDPVKWDKSPHWRTRVKLAVENHGDDPAMIDQIKSVESPGVVKAIDQALAAR
jgi:hypothetical protein